MITTIDNNTIVDMSMYHATSGNRVPNILLGERLEEDYNEENGGDILPDL